MADLGPGTMPRGKYPESPAPAGSHALISRTPTPGGMLHANLGLPRPPPRNFQPPLPQQPPKQTQQRPHAKFPIPPPPATARARPDKKEKTRPERPGFPEAVHTPLTRWGNYIIKIPDVSHFLPPSPKKTVPPPPATARARPCKRESPARNSGWAFMRRCTRPYSMGELYYKNPGYQPFSAKTIGTYIPIAARGYLSSRPPP